MSVMRSRPSRLDTDSHKQYLLWQIAVIFLLTSPYLTCVWAQGSFRPEMRPVVAHTNWIGRDGAPGNINALAQTTDGYLWLGTPLGLYRFDGRQFASYPVTTLEAKLPSTDIEALSSDTHNGLWIGFRMGGISHLLSDGSVVNYNLKNGLGPNSAQKFIIRSDGAVWAIGDNRLLVLHGERWEDFGSKHGLPNDQLFTLFFDHKGNLWTSARHKLFVLHPGQSAFELYPLESFMIVDMAETSDGHLWVSDAWRSIHPLIASDGQTIPTNGYVRILIDRSGTLWLAQDYRGVSHLPSQRHTVDQPLPVKEEDLSSEQTNSLLQDRDGEIWVGTSRGLDRFRASPFERLSNIRVEYYPALASDPANGVWLATLAHPVIHASGRDLKAFGHLAGSSPIICDDSGSLWMVDPINNMLTQYKGSQILRTPVPEAVHQAPAESIGLNRDGTILVSFKEAGLWRFDGSWERLHDGTLPDDDPLTIVRDSEHRVWLGYANSTIVMLDAAGFHAFTAQQAGDLGNVLTFAATHNRLWAAGANGLAYYQDGSFHRISLRRDAVLRGVSGVVEDKNENLWLNASSGIVRVPAEELRKISRDSSTVDSDLFDDRQGVVGTATQMKPAPSAVADRNGPLWFSTSGEVFSLENTETSFQSSLPVVTVQNVSVDGVTVIDREHSAASVKLNALHLKDVEIDYAGIDLTSSEKVRYKYMLEGVDQTWHDAGSRRQAFYGQLGPGRYRFRVLATSGREQWSELPVPIVLDVTPAFYQQLWFYALSTIVVLALLYLLYLVRVRYVTGRLRERLKERSSERLRIARELHDTLLQSIHGLMLRFHFATEGLPETEPARKPLQVALSRADAVFVEARRRIEALRDEAPGEGTLADQLAAIAEELEIGRLMSFRIVEEGQPQYLNLDVQAELRWIAREALLNTMHHSNTESAEIQLVYGGSEFLIKCCDAGVGLPTSVLEAGRRTGHWGLVGMRERANTIDGDLQLWSAPGAGTQIEIRVPARRAYRYASKRFVWFERLLQFRRDATGQEQAPPS